MKLSDLRPNPDNPRVSRDEAFRKLCRSIAEFPAMMALRPIVVDENNTVLGGNMRLAALKELSYDEIPDEWVKQAATLTDYEKKRFVIADNVAFGDWDYETLAAEWGDLPLADWGLEQTPANQAAEADDYTPPAMAQTDILPGDLIEIGPHRLLCGDNTNLAAICRLFDGNKADMVLTDPPYENDFDYAPVLLLAENAHVLVFNNDRALIRQLSNSPLKFKKFFVFNHSGCAIPQEGGNEAFLDHILVSHETHGKPKTRFNKGTGLRTVIKGEYRKSDDHDHQKPVALIESLIGAYTQEGDIVADWFAGSGTTMVAAHTTGRICYAMEMSPQYCQVIVDRMRELSPDIEINVNQRNP